MLARIRKLIQSTPQAPDDRATGLLGSALLLRSWLCRVHPPSGGLAQDAIDLSSRDAHLMRDGARSGPLGLERPHPGAVDALETALIDSLPPGLGDALRLALAAHIGLESGEDG